MTKRLTIEQRNIRRRRSKGIYGGKGLAPGSYLTKDQVRIVLEYCTEKADKGGLRAAITLILIESFLYTGLRATELIGLLIKDLPGYNGKEDVLIVPAELGKGGKQRTIMVDPYIVKKWERYLKRFRPKALRLIASTNYRANRRGQSKCVFINEKLKQLEYHAAYQRLRRVAIETGVPLRPHILRHTYAVGLVETGAKLEFIQDQLGHSSPATTRIYAQVPNLLAKKQLGKLQWWRKSNEQKFI